MAQTVEAVYENGTLRPVQPLTGIREHARVKVTIEEAEPAPHPLADCVGTLPKEDADELTRIIEEEFERVDQDEWK